MKYLFLILIASCLLSTGVNSQKKHVPAKSMVYFPPAGQWKHQPAYVFFDTVKLRAAIQFAKDHEINQTRNMELLQATTFGKEPFGEGIGPFANRGEPTGLILYKGMIVAEWGEPNRVDMTHSVTKSFLSTVVGLAVEKGLIKEVTDKVIDYVPFVELYDPLRANRAAEEMDKPLLVYPFNTLHNQAITWDDMLRQTSDWEGTLWGKPEWADRPNADITTWLTRPRKTPGTVWEYNDVRVNALALAATNVWRTPLPQVLKQHVMDPIGASTTWRWTGYKNAYIVLDGQIMQSVSGGGHWGGGMFINAYDMARFGLLTLHKGNWNGQQLIPETWIERSLTPTLPQPTYGYMNFFLNTDKKYYPSAAASAFVHVGNGTNIIYVDRENDLVLVARWIDNKKIDGLVKGVLEAFKAH